MVDSQEPTPVLSKCMLDTESRALLLRELLRLLLRLAFTESSFPKGVSRVSRNIKAVRFRLVESATEPVTFSVVVDTALCEDN
jgi:hypothetical protein